MYLPIYLPVFKENIEKHSNLKRFTERKINSILEHPYNSESLKYALSGLRSCPVRRNYLIIFGILEEHKKCNFEFGFNLEVLKDYDDKTIIFLIFGPHDDAYKIAKKMAEIGMLSDPNLENLPTNKIK